MIVASYLKCWACNYDEHPNDLHTWMDDEDRAQLVRTGQLRKDHSLRSLAIEHPCACWCVGPFLEES